MCIDVLRRHPPAIEWLSSIQAEEVALPGFVYMELLRGCRNGAEQERLERVFGGHEIVWPMPDACNAALAVYEQHRLSHGLGILDALIGQLAASLSTTLYSFNSKDFRIISGLNLIQPYLR